MTSSVAESGSMRRWSAAVLAVLLLPELLFQARDLAIEVSDPVAPSRVGPVREGTVLVIGGRAAHGYAVDSGEAWPVVFAKDAPIASRPRFLRARLGLNRVLDELPAMLAESRPEVVVFQVGGDEAFDDPVESSERTRRRLDGYALRLGWLEWFSGDAAATADDLLGDWTVGPVHMTFREDGVLMMNGLISFWTAKDGRLFVTQVDGSQQQGDYSIFEDTLKVRGLGGADFVLQRGVSEKSLVSRAQRTLRAGDVLQTEILVESLRSKRLDNPAWRALAARLEDPPIVSDASVPNDLKRVARDLDRIVRACRIYGAEPMFVELPVPHGEFEDVLRDLASRHGVEVIDCRDALHADALRGIDCTAVGHRIVAERVASALAQRRRDR